MTAEALLQRLDRVRQRGADQWSARCPAHDDKGPSLSVKELSDGRVLLHCFAGCEVAEVVAAVGLEIAELFPPRPADGQGSPPERRRGLLTAMQALELIDHEARLIWVSGENIAAGITLAPAELDRVRQAAGRIGFALQEVRS
jgi:hypothetical protein